MTFCFGVTNQSTNMCLKLVSALCLSLKAMGLVVKEEYQSKAIPFKYTGTSSNFQRAFHQLATAACLNSEYHLSGSWVPSPLKKLTGRMFFLAPPFTNAAAKVLIAVAASAIARSAIIGGGL